MALQAELSGTFSKMGPLVEKLLSEIGSPLGKLSSVGQPVTADQLGGVSGGAAQVDTSSIGTALARVTDHATPLLTSLPGAHDVIAPLTATLELVERVTAGNLTAQFADRLANLAQEIEGPRDGGFIALLHNLAQGLADAPEGKVLLDLVTSLTSGTGVNLPTTLPIADALQAVDGAVRTLGGLMGLESVLAEAERLTAAMATQLDVNTRRQQIAALDHYLSGDTVSLADFVAAAPVDDPAAVGAAVDAVAAYTAQLDAIQQSLAGAMGLGEATLVYLDIDKVQLEIEAAAALVRTADLDPLGRLTGSLAAGVRPLLTLDLTAAPQQQLDTLLTSAETQVADFAAKVGALDVAEFANPLAQGIAIITTPLDRISEILTRIAVGFQSAMHQVRDAVAALPFGLIADAVRSVLEPITKLIDVIKQLVDDIEAALNTAATATHEALAEVEGLVDSFKKEIDTLFGGAKVILSGIDQVVGAIAENIKKFADELQKAHMQPYFDTAAQVIGTTADVIGALPLGLLPDSMKSKIDEALQPIKDADAHAVETEIEGLLQIGEDGTFQLRGTLDEALSEIQAKYDELIQTIKDANPRTALANVDAKLTEITAKIHEITPALTLQPVQEAIDKVKAAVASIDLDHQLQPVRDVFDRILGALDQYEPSKLVGDVEARITAAREKLLAEIHLEEWGATLDDLLDRGTALLDKFDPTRLGAQIEAALDEAIELLERFPGIRAAGGLGTILASLLNGIGLRIHSSSFDAVLDWLSGASATAALNARAARISDSVASTRDAVVALDLTALSSNIVQQVGRLRPAVATLVAALPAEMPQRAQLTTAMERLDAAGTFADLVGNRARYLAALTRSAALAETLRRTGFSEADVAVAKLRTAIDPLQPSIDFVRRLLERLGITGVDGGIAGVLHAVLAVAPPARLTGIVMPIFVAVRDRISTLLSAVVTPVKDGINKIEQLIDAIDLKPFTSALDDVFNEVKDQIKILAPDQLLKEPLDAFKSLQDDLRNQDPLAKVIGIITDLRDAIERILGKLTLENLLQSPLAIYDGILNELGKLDIQKLIAPVLDQLDNIAHQVDDGLDRTVAAFQQLQAALPGDNGGGGVTGAVGGAISGSTDVSLGGP